MRLPAERASGRCYPSGEAPEPRCKTTRHSPTHSTLFLLSAAHGEAMEGLSGMLGPSDRELGQTGPGALARTGPGRSAANELADELA